MEAVLTLIEPSPGTPPSFAVPKGAERRLGRGPDCELRVKDPTVGRLHAVLRFSGEKVEVSLDPKASPGAGDIYVNDTRTKEWRALEAGDRVSIGSLSWRVEYVEAGKS
jgi:hypothetical protein